MADQETRIRLTAVDETAKAMNSAAKNAVNLEKQLTKTFTVPQIKLAELTKAATGGLGAISGSAANTSTALAGLGVAGTRVAGAIRTGFGSVARMMSTTLTPAVDNAGMALAAMGGRMLGVAAAGEAARRSFLGFASIDDRMRLMQNQAGATRQEIEKTTKSLRSLAGETGTPMRELIEGFDALREGAGLSLQETEAIFPKVAKAARGMGGNVELLSKSMAAMMRNMKVPANEVGLALDYIAKGVFDFKLNADELARNMPKLTEAMSEWGYTGKDGIGRMVAILGSFQNVTKDTGESVNMFSRTLEMMVSPEVSKMLTNTEKGMTNILRNAQRQGKDVYGVFIGLLKQHKYRDDVLAKFSNRERRAIRESMKDYNEMGQRITSVFNSAGVAMQGYENRQEGPQARLDKMIASVDELGGEFGELLSTLGATEGVKWLTQQIKDLQVEVKQLRELYDYLFKGGAKPKWMEEKNWSETIFGPKGADNPLNPGKSGSARSNKLSAYPTPGEETRRDAYNRERREREEAQKKFEELKKKTDETTTGLKKMSMELDDTTEAVKIWKTALGVGNLGPGGTPGVGYASSSGSGGGARVMNASYSPGGGVPGGSPPGTGGNAGTGGPGGPAGLSDESGRKIDAGTMAEAEQLGRKGDEAGLKRLFASKGYRMSGRACGMVASAYTSSAGFKPVAGGAIASNWRNWGEASSAEDVNKADRPFGSTVATYRSRRYGGGVGQPLPTGATGGHVMTIVPGSYNKKDGTVGVVDQYGYGRRKVSDMDFRYAGDAAVAAAREKSQGDKTARPDQSAPGVDSPKTKRDPRGMENHIRETAKKYGIDPDVAVRVAQSEGLGTFQSSVPKSGKGSYNGREDSWGAFQLYKGGGLGNDFEKETGLDPRDPKNEKATIDFALRHASKKGWGAFHGAKNTGIGPRQGIGVAPPTVARPAAPAAAPSAGTPSQPRGDMDVPVQMNVKVNDSDMQFARRTLRREADREVREARWNSYSDIGAA